MATELNTVNSTANFRGWVEDLADLKAKARIFSRITNMRRGNFGDCEAIGDGLSELRIDFGPGYRIYFGRSDSVTYLLLCGGDKASQKADIRQAKKLWTDIKNGA